MVTQFAIDCALMAGASYISTRPFDVNKFPIPAGWATVPNSYFNDPSSGFEAVAFQKGTDIVISYAGTDPSDIAGDIAANLALAAGTLSDQLRQAADYYLQVKNDPANAGKTISFTGHSLGGGLASLMAVMFGESAYTFDQAPFLNSAKTFTSTDPLTGNPITRSVALDLRAYLTGRATDTMLAKLDAYIAAADPSNLTPNPADTLAARSGQVTNINTQGEFLSSWFLVPSSNRIGSQGNIANIDNISGLDLHAQALLTAMLQSGDTPTSTASDHTLGQVTFKLPDLLKMIFNKDLFAYDTKKDKPNFLERLVQQQAPANMGTRFTTDLWKIAQGGGLSLTDKNLADALTAFAMQMYYEDTANAKDKSKQLFSDVTGGIQFDMADVSQTFAAAVTKNEKFNLDDAKGFKAYFRPFLDNYYWDSNSSTYSPDKNVILSMLPYMRDWYVQAGASGMLATDTQNRSAFMLGGTGQDTLTGGTEADLLVGNAGADTLQGGLGNDFLLGGTGNDTYKYTTDDGFDTLLDADGSGSIVIDGTTLAGGDQYDDTHVHRDANKHLYVDVGQGRLVIDGNILIEDQQAGEMGLAMAGAVALVGTANDDSYEFERRSA